MDKDFDIQTYMTKVVERILKDALKATLKNPKESAFMVKFAASSKSASNKRAELKQKGTHVPPFLIASITSQCNLHCEGCYSRCNNATVDEKPQEQLMKDDWDKVFGEASDLGVSFILLAGGEPMLRIDVIEAASTHKDIMFPIFTNGTYINEQYLKLFNKSRNLVPILSIEGNKEITDARRGEGVYDKLIQTMDEFKKRGIIFGASVTVTTDNVREVSSDEFIQSLADRGCKAVIFVEYVPVTDKSRELAPGDKERDYLSREINRLREQYSEMVFVSFPGDEKSSGGCIAAGRGFFHINSHGGAEPCPFSPYSDINVKDCSLLDAIDSKLFVALRSGDILADDHKGGCVLYEKREQVEEIINDER